ncbi:amidohydrolase [Arthrobacter sp. RCC_34]|uniref:amidohydrolase n=1 Tax=Arthrobacter sp. RCC_34 TaxID=3239230 RepID=UPI003524B7A1
MTGHAPQPADAVYRVAEVENFDDGATNRPPVSAADPLGAFVAVRDGCVVAVGADPAAWIGEGTEVHDLPGATLIPGLVDPHTHPVWGAIEQGQGVDLAPAVTLAEVLELLADRVRESPDGAWVTGYGLDVNVFPAVPEGRFLGESFPGVPVSLMTADAHSLVISPAAVAIAGLTGAEVFDDKSSVELAADGAPSGYVLELQAMDLVFAHYPEAPLEESAGYVLAQLEAFASWGLTGVHALDFAAPGEEVYRWIEEHGELPVRVRCSPLVPADSTPEVWAETAALIGRHGRRWSVEGVKFMLDGTADNGTAWFEHADSHGENQDALWRDPDAYAAAVEFFTAQGIPTATHAIGDRAVRHALDAIQAAGTAAGGPHRIEHVESIPDALLPRFGELGVVASLQPSHGARMTAADGSDNWSRRIGRERAAHGWRTRDLLAAGAAVALGSDWPIGPGDPRVGLADAQLRRPVEDPDVRPVQEHQAVDVRHAYRGMTSVAALAGGRGDSAGRVEPGRVADFTLLGANPVSLTPEEQAANPVLGTVIGGNMVFRAVQVVPAGA